MMNNGDSLQRALAASQGRSENLLGLLLALGEEAFSQLHTAFFVVSVDLLTDLFYAPVSNVALRDLGAIVSEPGERVLDVIRNRFPIGERGTLFVKHLVERASSQLAGPGTPIFLRLNEDGTPDPQFQILGADQLRPMDFASYFGPMTAPGLDPEIAGQVEALRRLRGPEAASFLMILPRAMPVDTTGVRQSEIVQLGFLFAQPREDGIPTEAALLAAQAAAVSNFATLNLLLERERYFQKALRQAIRGSILKYGDGIDIVYQIAILEKLAARASLQVPEVTRKDPDCGKGSTPSLAWYEMTRFSLPSMLDLFTSTAGLEDYEVTALSRSCVDHLRRTYWEPSLQAERARYRPCLVTALALALDRTRAACVAIRHRGRQILTGTPVKTKKRIDIFDAKGLRDLAPLIDAAQPSSRETILINAEWLGWRRSLKCRNPVQILNGLRASFGSLRDDFVVTRCEIDGGCLHGDAHFGNLLVDASVPEDPLVVSIDQKQVDCLKDKDTYAAVARNACSSKALERELLAISGDPAYDIAKILLSTCCCYDIAYRKGFTWRKERKRSGVVGYTLSRASEDQLAKLGDVGGISEAHIVAIDAPVPEESWRYHLVAGRVALREYWRCLHAVLGRPRAPDLTAAAIRLWLLTVRHAFSIVEILFPRDVDRAIAVYLSAAQFVNHGAGIIRKHARDPCGIDLADLEQLFLLTEA